MRKITVLIYSVLLLNISLSAQYNKPVTIKSGTKIVDYFTVQDRYSYPAFLPGQVFFKNGTVNEGMLNYGYLTGEMEFLQDRDTLALTRKKDIRFVVVAQDTFYYDNGYIKQLSGGPVKVGLKENYVIKDVVKIGAYGMPARNSSIDSYTKVASSNISYDLVPNEDIVLQKISQYFINTPSLSGYMPFTKKNVIQLFPQREDEIKAYLKSNKVNFETGKDLIRLADFLSKP